MDPSRHLYRLIHHLDRLLARLNTFLSLIYVLLVTSLISFSAYLYLHHLNPLLRTALPPPLFHVHTFVTLYLLLSTTVNYLLCIRTCAGKPCMDTEAGSGKPFPESPKNTTTPDLLLAPTRTRSETWRWCTTCRATKPPRAHHCTACNACFHRLCHHCPAVGGCVGRDNYPFFFRFITSAWTGALLLTASAGWLARKHAQVLQASEKDVLFFAGVGGCGVAVATGVLACWHVFLLGTGQTTVEWLENLQARRAGMAPAEWGRWGGPFSKGVRGNVREAFGEIGGRFVPWWIVLLVPVGRGMSPEPVGG